MAETTARERARVAVNELDESVLRRAMFGHPGAEEAIVDAVLAAAASPSSSEGRAQLSEIWRRVVPVRWVYDWLHEIQSDGGLAGRFAQQIEARIAPTPGRTPREWTLVRERAGHEYGDRWMVWETPPDNADDRFEIVRAGELLGSAPTSGHADGSPAAAAGRGTGR